MDGSRCILAMNVLAARIAATRPLDEFPGRANGILCHNNLYLGSLIAPIPLMVPGLVVSFAAEGSGCSGRRRPARLPLLRCLQADGMPALRGQGTLPQRPGDGDRVGVCSVNVNPVPALSC